MSINFKTNSIDQTNYFAGRVAEKLKPGDILVLTGELGSGKTTFTKGLAKALGIKDRVKSPTFTLVREYYDGKIPLFHMDAYRLDEKTDDFGLEEYFDSDGISVIEWGQNIKRLIPKDYIELIFKVDALTNEREILLINHKNNIDQER